ncbi:MAG: SidJ-related pseudokinase [Desulfobacterales bacterium]
MRTWSPERLIHRLETAVAAQRPSFTAAFMTVHSLRGMVEDYPELAGKRTAQALDVLLGQTCYTRQTQALAFYREVSHALAAILMHAVDSEVFESALAILKKFTAKTDGVRQRAAAEALGCLPLHIRGPEIERTPAENIPEVPFCRMAEAAPMRGNPKILGRSIVWDIDGIEGVFVVKQAGSNSALDGLRKEIEWMRYLRRTNTDVGEPFHVPKPCGFCDSYIVKPVGLPATIKKRLPANGTGAIAFIAHKNYFSYPNPTEASRRLGREDFAAVIKGNARTLGRLTRMGIIHTAPIPLFHNRTQQSRRHDNGIYDWPRGGRLDQWLQSCRFPNFGISGIRDFEHLKAFTGPDQLLYRHIGTQLMSLVLVAGSWFRNAAPHLRGFDEAGNPVDARDLFDPVYYKKLLIDMYTSYYRGFVGRPFNGELPADLNRLTDRLIEEMGCDRDMVEVFRIADQLALSDFECERFLRRKGFSLDERAAFKKGVRDVTIHSGPHLGYFNGRISIPELITFLAGASAFCIADAFCQSRWTTFS